jgi:type II secretory ATPase GspE/PulE/Tfp pilus assembly ATPase PilB-like protein
MAINPDLLGASHKPPADIEDYVYFENGVLYVASSYQYSSRVLAWENKLTRLGILIRKEAHSMEEIEQLRKRSVSTERRLTAADELRIALGFIDHGVKMKASDLHFVVQDNRCKVLYRVDGFLDVYTEISRQEAMQYISALYVSSDVKNRGGFSFDGPIAARIRTGLPEGVYAVRFASMKTDRGGMVALRLLYDTVANRAYSSSIDLPTLGFNERQVELLKEMAAAPNGLIVIDGPTGSGKSTTLKYILQWVRQQYPQFNILTVEDPPEYPIVGAQQIPVLTQDGDVDDMDARSRAYGAIISTTLRLDPDVLMVGEVRDGTSAISALRAAITGHRLWTTVHANDAWEAVNRLVDLLREGGMMDPIPVLANTQNLAGLIAQRLVPTLCPYCKIPFDEGQSRLPSVVLDELLAAVPDLDAAQVYVRGDGCQHCVPASGVGDSQKKTDDMRRGILGRTVVAEIVRPSQRLLDVTREKGVPAAREFWLRHAGGATIADHALEKICAGLVDPAVARDFIGPLVSSRQLLAAYDAEQS